MKALLASLLSIWAREPAAVTGAITSVVAVLVVFGVPITDAQDHALLAAVVGVSPLVAMLVVRSQVIPSSGATGAAPGVPPPPPKPPSLPPLPPAAVLALVAIALLTGCAGITPRDAAVDSINASSTLATQAEPMLAKMDRDEQKACETLKPPASPKDCADEVRARYAKAWKAYVDFLVARTLAVTTVNTYDAVKGVGVQPTDAEIAKVVGDLAAAESAFSAAMSTVKGAPIQ